MESTSIVIVGTGGSGREAASVIGDIVRSEAEDWRLIGYLDEAQVARTSTAQLAAPLLGSPLDVELLAALPRPCAFTIAIGDGSVRNRLRKALLASGMTEAVLIHPAAVIGPDTEICGGTINAGTILTTGVRLGASVQIDIGCTLGHDVTLGNGVTVSPGANLSGFTVVGDGATIYTNATVLPGIHIGAGARVGAGAVVIEDVKAGDTVVGVPAVSLRTSLT